MAAANIRTVHAAEGRSAGVRGAGGASVLRLRRERLAMDGNQEI